MLTLSLEIRPSVSAIYFALLQTGYEFYIPERDISFTKELCEFFSGNVPAFFRGVKQDTCEAYPYWPRAALLETAVFYLTPTCDDWADFDAFRARVMNAPNLSPKERDNSFWAWIREFPAALHTVLHSPDFAEYLAWEKAWVKEQKVSRGAELQVLSDLLSYCAERYGSPIRQVNLLLQPIKCVYSADYHLFGDCFYDCSGSLNISSVLHEYLHPVVHPWVTANREVILAGKFVTDELEPTYTKAGKLYAFEELAVRTLTKSIMAGEYPPKLDAYLFTLINKESIL